MKLKSIYKRRNFKRLGAILVVMMITQVQSAASPILIADGLGNSQDLIATDGRLFFIENNGVSALPLDATGVVTPTNVVNGINNSTGSLMTDGTNLFGGTETYINSGYFWTASVNGVNQNRTTIVSGFSGGGSLHAVTDTHIIYDTRFESGPMYRAPKTGGTPVKHTNANSWARSSTYDENYVFWQQYRPETIYRTDLATGATIQLRQSFGYEHSIFNDDDFVYYVNAPANATGTIAYSDKNGNNMTDLVTGVSRIGWGTSVDGYVYFYNDPTSSIARIAVGGGEIQSLLAVNYADIRDVLVIDDTLYYIDGSGGNGQMSIYALAVPEPSTLCLFASFGLLLARRSRSTRLPMR